MSAQAHEPQAEPPRVPRTADGIASALSPARRMNFYRELGTAPLDQVEAILRRWWCEAMLDTDPHADQTHRAALDGSLSRSTLEEIQVRRSDLGLPVE